MARCMIGADHAVDREQGNEVTYKLVNAGECAYAFAFAGTTTCYSYDRKTWKRVIDSKYDSASGTFSWRHKAEADQVAVTTFLRLGLVLPNQLHVGKESSGMHSRLETSCMCGFHRSGLCKQARRAMMIDTRLKCRTLGLTG